MPYVEQAVDLSSSYQQYTRQRLTFGLRPRLLNPGYLVQYVSQDLQTYPDIKTIALPAAAVQKRMLLAGFVSDAWPGFNSGMANAVVLLVGANTVVGGALRGTQGVKVVTVALSPGDLPG